MVLRYVGKKILDQKENQGHAKTNELGGSGSLSFGIAIIRTHRDVLACCKTLCYLRIIIRGGRRLNTKLVDSQAF